MNDPLSVSALTVPVIVDDPAREAPNSAPPQSALVSLVRCVYFAFETSQPMPNWELGIGGLSMQFFMLGLSGVVFCTVDTPARGSGWFLSPLDIDFTFDFIERLQPMIVETGRIYLPIDIVHQFTGKLQIHDVLRVRGDLFQDAYLFANERLRDSEFAGRLSSYKMQTADSKAGIPPLQYSPDETHAFKFWSKQQFEDARMQEAGWASDGLLHPEEDRSKMEF